MAQNNSTAQHSTVTADQSADSEAAIVADELAKRFRTEALRGFKSA